MSSVILSGDTSGAITLSAPSVAGTNTLTLPAQTATLATLTTPSFATTIGVGGTTASASGAGVSFPATQSASSDANTLDDYEEGTWTPAFSPTGNSFGAISYTAQLGSYTKIGNVVTVWYRVSVNSVTLGSVSGNLAVTNLPFTVYNATNNYAQGTIDAGGFTTNQPTVDIGIINTTNIYVYYRASSNASVTSQTAGSTANGCYIYGTLTYQVA